MHANDNAVNLVHLDYHRSSHVTAEALCVHCVYRWKQPFRIGMHVKDIVCPGCDKDGGVIVP